MINVTKSFLPPIEAYTKLLEGIWSRAHLTNNGPLLMELEEKLKDYFGANHFIFLNNGTSALQIAIKGLGITGEVITTPFSYVATTSSIVWENCEPVFADIDKNKDGKITKEELAAYFAARPAAPGRPAPDADAMLGRWDTNKDGAVSQAEFDARPRVGGIVIHILDPETPCHA